MREHQERLPGPSRQEAISEDAPGPVRVLSPAPEPVLQGGSPGPPARVLQGEPPGLGPDDKQEGQKIQRQQQEATGGQGDELFDEVELVLLGSH